MENQEKRYDKNVEWEYEPLTITEFISRIKELMGKIYAVRCEMKPFIEELETIFWYQEIAFNPDLDLDYDDDNYPEYVRKLKSIWEQYGTDEDGSWGNIFFEVLYKTENSLRSVMKKFLLYRLSEGDNSSWRLNSCELRNDLKMWNVKEDGNARVFLEKGESIHYHGECFKMYTNFIAPNGDKCELYAEVKIPEKPVKEHYYMAEKCIDARPFFKKNGKLDGGKFFGFAESELKTELMRQAGEWKDLVYWDSAYWY